MPLPFDERPPPPPAPSVRLINDDGTPAQPLTDYLQKLWAWLDRFSSAFRFATPFTPTEATIAGAGSNGRTVCTMVAPAGMTAPITWTVTRNAANLGIKFLTTGALVSTSNPIGNVGTYFIEVQAADAASHVLTGDLKITLT